MRPYVTRLRLRRLPRLLKEVARSHRIVVFFFYVESSSTRVATAIDLKNNPTTSTSSDPVLLSAPSPSGVLTLGWVYDHEGSRRVHCQVPSNVSSTRWSNLLHADMQAMWLQALQQVPACRDGPLGIQVPREESRGHRLPGQMEAIKPSTLSGLMYHSPRDTSWGGRLPKSIDTTSYSKARFPYRVFM